MTYRRLLIVLTLMAVVLAATAGPSSGRTKAQRMRARMLHLVNNSRRAHDVAPVKLNLKLSEFAWRHSHRMALARSVYHSSDVWTQVRRFGARSWGENVGMAGTLQMLQRLFMRSPSHRANILARRFHRVGIGVVRAHHLRWVTLDFYG